jgi:hypothetical protein
MRLCLPRGRRAFREATPEGYQRAADAFRKAASLRPERCEYSLHLAESLLFLALEQKLNQEDTAPAGQEAGRIFVASGAQLAWGSYARPLSRDIGRHCDLCGRSTQRGSGAFQRLARYSLIWSSRS